MTEDASHRPGALPAADRSMLEHCESLRQIARALRAGEPSAAIRQQAAAVRLAIESTMFAHHRDEETLVFPALLEAMAGSDAVCLREMADSLASEHRAFETLWQALGQALAQIEAGERVHESVSKNIDTFADGYRAHVLREEQELYPMASRLLTDDEFAKLEQKFHGSPGT